MKKVAVSQRVDDHPVRNEIRDALDQRLTKFIKTAGYLPIPVPNGLVRNEVSSPTGLITDLQDWLALVDPDAIVLSGGNDIGTCIYRDQTEQMLLDFAEAKRVPVLGICRGMQMMAHAEGVSLIEVRGHVGTRHKLIGEIESDVNSFHSLALERCPPHYEVIACSEDGAIEAIRHQQHDWEGWMWHPERENIFSKHDVHRLRALFR